MSQEPYFVGDWQTSCAMLECQRDDCRTPEGYIFQEVLPYRATIDDIRRAFDRHVAYHMELDGVASREPQPR